MSYRTSAMRRPNTSAPGDGSRTMTITSAPPNEDDGSATDSGDSTPGTLRLRASTRKPRQRVVWREDVVDNEGTGKKSSKICCIYHKPKAFDESSDEEDSDSDSDSECEHRHAAHRHVHSGHGEQLQTRDAGAIVEHIEHAEPNAYEKAPSSKKPKHTED